MKKFISLAIVCCILLCSFSAFATAESIIINGETVSIPADMGRIREMDDRTFVPIRFVVEYLGCVVNYQETVYTEDGVDTLRRTATITDPSTGISYFVTAGDNKFFTLTMTGASVITMDTNAFIDDDEGRMYIPVRFLAEALGYTVDWDEETQTVILNKQ